MVRILAAKLIDIGSGKLSVDQFESHLIDPQLKQINKPAYPQGLYLSKVTYPFLDIAPRSNLPYKLFF
jgi:tRNA pseudouridine38-40 synthase